MKARWVKSFMRYFILAAVVFMLVNSGCKRQKEEKRDYWPVVDFSLPDYVDVFDRVVFDSLSTDMRNAERAVREAEIHSLRTSLQLSRIQPMPLNPPGLPDLPGIPSIPNIPSLPRLWDIPRIDIPSVPNIPSLPSIPRY